MKRILCIGLSLFIISNANARSGNIHNGSSMTLGPSSHSGSLSAGAYNPAAASIMIGDDEHYRINYFPSFSFEAEIGDVSNFEEDLNELIDLIDDPSLASDSLDETITYYNEVVEKMGEDGYLKSTIGIHAPIFPAFYKSDFLGGAIAVDLSVETQIAVRILDDVLTPTQEGGGIQTNTSIYMKSGIEKKVSVGYSRELNPERFFLPSSGKFYVGARLSFINLELSKQVIWLQDMQGQSVDGYIEDQYDNNLVTTTAPSIDVGALWIADRYQLGLTLSNINSPSFKYGNVGLNCSELETGSLAQNSCNVAQHFVEVRGELKARESHVKHAVATVDAAWSITSSWRVSTVFDLAAYSDIVGFDSQRFHIATAYESTKWYMPSPRFGYQTNLVGSELSSLNAGATLFGVVSFDLIYGMESTLVEGSELPRLFGFSLAFEERF